MMANNVLVQGFVIRGKKLSEPRGKVKLFFFFTKKFILIIISIMPFCPVLRGRLHYIIVIKGDY